MLRLVGGQAVGGVAVTTQTWTEDSVASKGGGGATGGKKSGPECSPVGPPHTAKPSLASVVSSSGLSRLVSMSLHHTHSLSL